MRLVGHGNAEGGDPPGFAQLLAYWDALRPSDGALPRRADIDPRGIADLLDRVVLAERIARGQLRIRLAGMAVCDLLGMDLRGMPLSALFVGDSRLMLADRLESVLAGPSIARLSLEAERAVLRPPMRAAMLALPLAGEDGSANRILALLHTERDPGRAPRRLVLTGSVLTAVDGVPPASRSAAPGLILPEATLPVEAAEEPAPFAPQLAGGKPHLRLVKG